MNKAELTSWLESHNVPLDQWGVGKAKTIDHLLTEINSGEAFVKEENGTLCRIVLGSGVRVYYQNGSTILLLKEQRQEFKDGRIRRRSLETSVGEKRHRDEEPLATAHRALREELKITDELELKLEQTTLKGPVASDSFPGLASKYIMHVWSVFLPAHLYKPEGYVEYQQDKTSYFVWVLA